ncbi:transcriptional regulator, TetR family [Geomicrobium sp. JCM 19037]|uniref:TetR/AcrR family transcriptional regulator n=1 Tax=Geomicrobium sp. JCM 19037 TaxID=1460634 RepID=UPI00045F27CC|nr:TetR/AcrR family transcriptional regulator [Geomicrobium sp. JCM 19037]GAK04236.1 transcriptional regulator, TetR family [Geomicrobium sp. JCM 19037]
MSAIEKKKGRPLDKSRDRIIMQSALELIGEHGYERVSMDRIAQHAGVGKATIYRRWTSKTHLVIQAISDVKPFEEILQEVEQFNDLRDQLFHLMASSFRIEDESIQRAYAAIGSAASQNQELELGLQQGYYHKFRLAFFAILDPYMYPNPALTLEQLDLIADIGPSMIHYRTIVTKKTIDANYIYQIIDELILPKLCH